MNVNEKYCVSIEDVYGVPLAALSAPQGYEFTGEFRPALSGEWYRKVYSNNPQKANHDSGEPRLILRALPTVESVYDGQTLEQLKENAKTATWSWDSSLKFEWTGLFTGAHRLIMRKCPTIKKIYGKELSELTPPKGYEFGEFRRLQKGDDWLSSFDFGLMVNCPAVVDDYRLILKKVTTVEDIYGAPLEKLTPPTGYRFTGEFRGLRKGDSWMPPTGGRACLDAHADKESVRLILEKLPVTPTIKDVYGTYNPDMPKGWRFKEFRQIKAGEDIHYLGYAFAGPISDRPVHARNEICNVANWKAGWRIVLEKEVDLREFKWPMEPKHVYGHKMPTVPSGYEVVAFRPPVEGELFIPTVGYGSPETAYMNFNSPRFILSPLGPR